MSTSRKLVLALGVALATASLSLAGSVPSLASPTKTTAAASPQAASVVPNPNAPHVGQVAGAKYGPGISIDNPTSIKAFTTLHEQMLGQTSDDEIPLIHEYVGTSFNTSTLGSQATQSVSTKIKPADPNTTLYTPTMYPSGGSCIEISTAYFHTSQVVAAWDWCKAITFVAEVAIDSDFMATYTQDKNYSTQILQTKESDNTWTAYIYNYDTAAWETFFTQNGTSQVGLAEGWDIYELYSNLKPNGNSYACSDLRKKRIEAQGIMVGVGGALVLADPTNSGDDYDVPLSEFHCPSLRYQMITQFNHWKARG